MWVGLVEGPVLISHEGPVLISHEGPVLISHEGPVLISHERPVLISHERPVLRNLGMHKLTHSIHQIFLCDNLAITIRCG